MNNLQYRIGDVYISVTDPENAISRIEEAVRKNITAHICVSDFRSVCYASMHPDYREIMTSSFMNLPDGMPLIWMARLWGVSRAHRTMGPELFVKMLLKKENGIRHFLLGDTDETLEKIRSEYVEKHDSLIAGTYSPPFIDVKEYDYRAIAELVNKSHADILWVSMTAPKQDYFAVNIEPFLEKKIIIGVGAAFKYSLGYYKIPSAFFQKIGLTGFFMRAKTWKQFKWYVVHIIRLTRFSLGIMGRRLTGKKYHE